MADTVYNLSVDEMGIEYVSVAEHEDGHYTEIQQIYPEFGRDVIEILDYLRGDT